MVIRRRITEPLGILLAHDGGLMTVVPGGDRNPVVEGHRFTTVAYYDGLAIAGSPEGGAWIHDGRRWEHRWPGNARSVSVLPNGDLYVGAAGGQLYRSTNKGHDWSEIAGVANLVRHGMLYKPNAGESRIAVTTVVQADDALIVGLGGGGAWQTRDLGDLWTRRTDGLDLKLHGIWPHPERADRLYASADSGIFRSEDEGFSWLQCLGGLDRSWGGSIAIMPGAPDALVATLARSASGEGGAVFRSPNGGVSWARVELEADSEWDRIPCVTRPWDWEDVAFLMAGTKLWASHDRGKTFLELEHDLPVANAIAASL